ncbi:MAG TPA: GNAT family N-acetyltransferase [Firmicutes bacterium]|nr:GNAT family N-acetyltransferase [Bacillota bacterium]
MIHIREVNAQNVFDICELTTNRDGAGTTMEEFLCCNAVSVAESKYYPEMHPNAIYNGGIPVGFFMYRRCEAEADTATLCRFMIDYRYQHKGLGRKAFQRILSGLKIQGVKRVVLMIDDANEIARRLYLSFGFVFTGKTEKNEYYYERKL